MAEEDYFDAKGVESRGRSGQYRVGFIIDAESRKEKG